MCRDVKVDSDAFWNSLDLIKILTVCDDCKSATLRLSYTGVLKPTTDTVCNMSWRRFGLFSSESTPCSDSRQPFTAASASMQPSSDTGAASSSTLAEVLSKPICSLLATVP